MSLQSRVLKNDAVDLFNDRVLVSESVLSNVSLVSLASHANFQKR